MSTNEPLKPCPFGCVGERRMNGNHASAAFWVSCEACCIRGRIARYPEDAAEYWNRRPAAIPTGEGLKPVAWARPRKNSDDMFSVMSPEDKEEFGDVGHAVRHSVPLYTAEQLSRLASSTGAQAEGKA